MKNKKQKHDSSPKHEITRKEALKKAGKYAAFTAATMMMILKPTNAAAQTSPDSSPRAPRDW